MVNPLPGLFILPDFSLVSLPIYIAGVCRKKDPGSIGSRIKRYGSGKGAVPDKCVPNLLCADIPKKSKRMLPAYFKPLPYHSK
jgi:hypothetical protein